MIGVAKLFVPILRLFTRFLKAFYYFSSINYIQKVKIGFFKYRIGFTVSYDNNAYSEYYSDLLGINNDVDLTDNNKNSIPDALESKLLLDSDSDGLPDIFEKVYGTDINDKDTDKDNLSDYYECFVLNSDPLNPDSDNNGISDDKEDFDLDGLTNLQECEFATHPLKSDTDNDTLSDFYEIEKSNTNPLSKDTDSDGLNDNDELTYKMNPRKSSSLSDGILDGDRSFNVSYESDESDSKNVKAKLELDLKGNQIESLSVTKITEDNFLNESIPGYIGNAYDLNVDGSFSGAKLTFELDKSLFNDSAFSPAIYYWNEETELLERLTDQNIDGNKVSATLQHFSKYIIVNENEYLCSWLDYEIEAPVSSGSQSTKYEMILALDESGSISSSDFSLMKDDSLTLLGQFGENDRVGILTFDSSIRTISELTDVSTAASNLKNIAQHNGSTALYGAVNKAISMFSSEGDSAKIIVVLTDGQNNCSPSDYLTVLKSAQDKNIKIYTIGVGSSVNSSVLNAFAMQTSGQYYSISKFDTLTQAFTKVITDADLHKDSDNDGISDYHEKCLASGKMRTGSGSIALDFSTLNYLNDDSDNDGLLDGEEIEIKEAEINGETVYYCYLLSNPCDTDSDSDGLPDAAEIYAGFEPLIYNDSQDVPASSSSAVNTKKDWTEMIEENGAWNFIHNAVEEDIRYKTPGMYPTELVLRTDEGKYKRVDLYYPLTGEIWDVKPASYQFDSARTEKVKAQLGGYVALGPLNSLTLTLGGSLIKDGSLTIGNYDVSYNNLYYLQRGLVTYHFTRTIPYAPVAVPDTVPVTDEEPSESQWYTVLWEWAAAFGYNCAKFCDYVIE